MKELSISNHQSNQQILKSVISNAVSSLSGDMLSYSLGFMLLHNTHSPLSFGLDLAINPIVDFLLFIPIGNYVDRHSHKKILTVNYILRLILLMLFAIILPLFTKTQELIPVMIFVALSEFCSNVSNTTYTASVHELVNKHKISALNSYEQACGTGASFFAPILSAVLYSFVNINIFIIIEFISTAFAFGTMLTMNFITKNAPIKLKSMKAKHQQLHDFKTGFNHIKKRKLLQDLMGIACVANLLGSLLNIAPSYIIIDRLHLPNEVVSFLASGLILGLVVGSILTNWIIKIVNLFSIFLYSFITIGLCTMGLGILFNYTASFWSITNLGTFLSLIMGLFLGVANVSVSVRIQSTVPTKLMGRVSSTMSAINTIFMPVGTILFSFLLKYFTNDIYIFVITGALLIIYFMLCANKFYEDIKTDDKFITEVKNKSTK